MIWNIVTANREIDRMTVEIGTLKETIEAQTKAAQVLADENAKLKSDLALALEKVAATENVDRLAGQKAAEIVAQQGIPPIPDKAKAEPGKPQLRGRERAAAAIKAELNGKQ